MNLKSLSLSLLQPPTPPHTLCFSQNPSLLTKKTRKVVTTNFSILNSARDYERERVENFESQTHRETQTFHHLLTHTSCFSQNPSFEKKSLQRTCRDFEFFKRESRVEISILRHTERETQKFNRRDSECERERVEIFNIFQEFEITQISLRVRRYGFSRDFQNF